MTASDPSRPVEDPARTGAAPDGTAAPSDRHRDHAREPAPAGARPSWAPSS